MYIYIYIYIYINIYIYLSVYIFDNHMALIIHFIKLGNHTKR